MLLAFVVMVCRHSTKCEAVFGSLLTEDPSRYVLSATSWSSHTGLNFAGQCPSHIFNMETSNLHPGEGLVARN
jgi:hypothetical protein